VASCLASADRITLTNGIRTTFLHIFALVHLTGTTLGLAGVTLCLDLEFKAESRTREVRIIVAKPTVINERTTTNNKQHQQQHLFALHSNSNWSPKITKKLI